MGTGRYEIDGRVNYESGNLDDLAAGDGAFHVIVEVFGELVEGNRFAGDAVEVSGLQITAQASP
ncbi:MAG: hypothetical protein KJN72_13850, partial [Woeseia sp.]|nr:hypothetical protein [Woeseia sp.]